MKTTKRKWNKSEEKARNKIKVAKRIKTIIRKALENMDVYRERNGEVVGVSVVGGNKEKEEEVPP